MDIYSIAPLQVLETRFISLICIYIYIYMICISINMYTAAAAAKLLQSCPILCNPIDGSPPGSPVLGILQARTLDWVAISFYAHTYICVSCLFE